MSRCSNEFNLNYYQNSGIAITRFNPSLIQPCLNNNSDAMPPCNYAVSIIMRPPASAMLMHCGQGLIMLINIKVSPKSSRNEVTKLDDSHFRVKVTAAPDKGKANDAVIELLSDYFHVAKSRIYIVSGKTSRNKTVEIS